MMDNTASRAVPPPRRPWIMTQRWHHLLFAHWPCAPDALRPLLPRQVTLDTFAGEAWVGIVVFGLSGIRLRALSPIPLVARFLEINVRTYVTANNRPGVYFLSLDPNNPLAVAIARPWFRLAYQHARIDFQIAGDVVNFASTRLERGAPDAQFAVRYRPTSAVAMHKAGTLEHWLTELYCYYSTSRRGIRFAEQCTTHPGRCRPRKPGLPGTRWRRRMVSRCATRRRCCTTPTNCRHGSGGRSA